MKSIKMQFLGALLLVSPVYAGTGDLIVDGKLQVGSSITAGKHTTHALWYNLATPPQGPGVPGYVKLVTPIQKTEGNMFLLKIHGYRYRMSRPIEIQCAGYAYNPSGLIYSSCRTEGTSESVGIGTENDTVIVTIGNGTTGPWYFDHFTVEYVGWKAKNAEDFSWGFVYNALPPTTNTNNVYIDDPTGTITTTGKVGIGTADPASDLEVENIERVARTDLKDLLTIDRPATTLPYLGFGSGLLFKGSTYRSGSSSVNWARIYTKLNDHSTSTSGTDLVFQTSPLDDGVLADALIIKYNGNVGIGKTPLYPLDVDGIIRGSNVSTTSDVNLKTDIQPIPSALDKLGKIEGVSFTWKKTDDSSNFPEGRHYGVIAQQIEKVVPEVVNTAPDGIKSVAYTEIIPILIEAIKEQQKQIDELKKSLAQKK